MFIMTDSVRSLLAELASAGRMEIEMDTDHIRVAVDCGEPAKRRARDASASRPAPKEPSKPRFGRKPGRKAKAEYKVVDGVRRRLHTFNGETLTLQEWAKKYNVGEKTMASRFRVSGTPETQRNSSKSDKNSLKARLGGAK
jgi:hypothetical protein